MNADEGATPTGGSTMGLIRKTLMVSSGGLVRGSSKKQRVAKAQLNQLKQQTALMKEEQREAERDRRITLQGQRVPAVSGTHEERKAALDRIRAAANGAQGVEASQLKWAAIQQNAAQRAEVQAIPAAPTLPPAGWYPDPDREHLLCWWDGATWTDRTAPRV